MLQAYNAVWRTITELKMIYVCLSNIAVASSIIVIKYIHNIKNILVLLH